MSADLPGAFAVLEGAEWAPAQRSALSMFGDARDEFLDKWPRAGSLRDHAAHERPPASPVRAEDCGQHRVWPTPRSRDRQPLGATEWELTERPSRMDLLHVRVARLWPQLWIPDESLTVAQRTPALNPLFVEALQGFPEGWTEMPLDG